LYARRSQDNIFLGVNRFLHEEEAVELTPASFTPSVWTTRVQPEAVGYSPFVLPGTDFFHVAARYSDELQSVGLSHILSFNDSLYELSVIANRPQPFLHASAIITGDEGKIAFAGGLNGGVAQSAFYVYDISGSIWTADNLSRPVAYTQMAAVDNNIFVFGGYAVADDMMRPNVTQNFKSSNGLSPLADSGSNFPARDQQLEDAIFYLRQGKLYRNAKDLSDERQVLDIGAMQILSPALSYDRMEICYHTPEHKLWIYNMVTETTKELRANARNCAWGDADERDYIYFADNSAMSPSFEHYGHLSKIRKDGTDFAGLNRDEYDLRRLRIADDGQVYMIAQAEHSVTGERVVAAVNGSSVLQDSDGTDEQALLDFPARDFIVRHGELAFIARPSDAQAGNTTGTAKDKENLFLSLTDGTDLRQAVYFPQGIAGRPALLESAEAVVAVSAFYVDENHLPLDYSGGCSVQYGDYVYLFGSGAGKDRILQYHIASDSWWELSEITPGTDGNFTCVYDNENTVYFQGDGQFARFDLVQKRFWPIDGPIGTDGSSRGPLAYTAGDQKFWFLDESVEPAGFFSFDTVAETWSTEPSPGLTVSGSRMITLGNDVYLFGNRTAIQSNKKLPEHGLLFQIFRMEMDWQIFLYCFARKQKIGLCWLVGKSAGFLPIRFIFTIALTLIRSR
jgi:hypothetical protein